MGKARNECMILLNGKNMRNRFAKKTCKTSMNECPDIMRLEDSSGLRYGRLTRYSR